MKSILIFAIIAILAIPTVACAWDEDGKYFEQQLMEAEAEAKLANYYDPAIEDSKEESDITIRTVCMKGCTILLTVDEVTGNLDTLQLLDPKNGKPIMCKQFHHQRQNEDQYQLVLAQKLIKNIKKCNQRQEFLMIQENFPGYAF